MTEPQQDQQQAEQPDRVVWPPSPAIEAEKEMLAEREDSEAPAPQDVSEGAGVDAGEGAPASTEQPSPSAPASQPATQPTPSA